MADFECLVDRIYEAATEPDLWPSLLTDVARSVDAEGGAIVTRRNDDWQWAGYRLSPQLANRFEECMRSGTAKRSITNVRLMDANYCGFLSDEELFTEEEYAADPWTTDWALPNHLYHGAATAIQVSTGDLVVVQIMRRAGLPGLSRDNLDNLNAFRPHLARAGFLAARWRLQRMRAAAEALALIGLAAAVLDLGGRVLAANSLIQAMTAHLVWLPDDQVGFRDAEATALLRKAIRNLADPAATCVRSFPARRSLSGEPVVVHLIPASRSAREVFEGGFGVLVVTPLTSPAPPDRALIQGLFDFTPAEARVACGIVAGRTISEMAACHGVALETVRTQVKAVLAKTGVRRQAEAAAKLAALPMIRQPE